VCRFLGESDVEADEIRLRKQVVKFAPFAANFVDPVLVDIGICNKEVESTLSGRRVDGFWVPSAPLSPLWAKRATDLPCPYQCRVCHEIVLEHPHRLTVSEDSFVEDE
jgi:hypothetical protein